MTMVTKLVQMATVFSLVKSLIPFLIAHSSLYTTFLLHLHHTRAGQICYRRSLSHQLPPKVLR